MQKIDCNNKCVGLQGFPPINFPGKCLFVPKTSINSFLHTARDNDYKLVIICLKCFALGLELGNKRE